MFLEKITIQNFKRIKKKTTFDLAPITILVGPNSSGKSSLLEAINLFDHLTDYVFNDNSSSQDFLDDLRFAEILSASSKIKKISIECNFSRYISSYDIPSSYINEDKVPFTPDKHGFPTPIVVGKDEISLKYILKDKNDSLLIDKIIINFNRTVKKEFLSAESENKYDDISYELKINYDKKSERAVKNILHDDLNSDSKEWSEFIKNLLLVSEIEYALQNIKKFVSYYSDIKFKLNRPIKTADPLKLQILENAIGVLFLNLNELKKDDELKNIVYTNFFSKKINLENEIDFKEFQKIINSSIAIVSQLSKEFKSILSLDFIDETRESPPELFEYHSGIVKNDYYNLLGFLNNLKENNNVININLRERFKYYLKEFNIADKLQVTEIAKISASRSFYKILFHWKNNAYSHNMLSSGNKQIIPVILKLLEPFHSIGSTNIIGIRQPELHLHPKLQMKIADLIYEKYQDGRYDTIQIIETHSEHLLRKLQIYVAKGELNKNSLKIFYFDPASKSLQSNIECLEFNERGMFTKPWPNGFFEESAVLNIQLIEAINSRKN